jgi:hypothetical protein
MAIPTELIKKIEIELQKYCNNRIPLEMREKVILVYKIEGNSIILIEKRPHFKIKNRIIESLIAKIKYINKTKEWELYYPNRKLGWSKYWNFKNKKRFSTIINEIDKDPTCIFWG